ncbi:MAG: hypothetical protein HQ546_06410 [Planctomycetes bacterium]|nr:hypothetical protein [Planctomycetota bacterium]
MTATPRQTGVTLVELIVATTVTVLVAGSTVAILRSCAAASQRADLQTSAQAEARAAVQAIATAIRNAFRSPDGSEFLQGIDGQRDGRPADRIRLFTVSRKTVRPNQPESDVVECEFFLGEPVPGAPSALMLRTDPTRNRPPDGGGVVERIAENVVALDLTYYDGLSWCQEWDGTKRHWPLAVAVKLAVATDGQAGKAQGKTLTVSRMVNFPYLNPGQGDSQ